MAVRPPLAHGPRRSVACEHVAGEGREEDVGVDEQRLAARLAKAEGLDERGADAARPEAQRGAGVGEVREAAQRVVDVVRVGVAGHDARSQRLRARARDDELASAVSQSFQAAASTLLPDALAAPR